ncbi:Maf family protein [Hahella ganghwensis]|uniref:Maf family protein n=1 Tax=Hahella ganghwensis TaxID=286420 RepID=UPI00037F1BCE|nr:Maf family protein [Hahella ganghwensis]
MKNPPLPTQIVLASTSSYRASLIKQLGLEFTTEAPNFIEEHTSESQPKQIAEFFAQGKALSLKDKYKQHLIIGSDQTASLEGRLLTKPGTIDRACDQLERCAGKQVTFYTGLALLNSQTNRLQSCVDTIEVSFRKLTQNQIENYVKRELPLDCCGSFKVEGLGISLFTSINGKDPNSLIGLPLIDLVTFLNKEGVNIP